MIVGINIFDLIIILGAIQGVIFAIYLWFKPLQNKKASLFLSLFILGFAASSIYYALETIGIRGHGINIWDFSLFYSSLLILPSFYLFIQYLIDPDRQFGMWDKLLFVPYAFQVFIQLWGSFWLIKDNDYLIGHLYILYKLYDVFDLVTLIMSMTLLVLSIIKIRKYDRSLQNNYAEIEDYSLSWINKLLIFLIGVWVLFALPTVYELVTEHRLMNIYYPMWIGSSILIYWIGYSTFFKRRTITPQLFDQQDKEDETKLSSNTKAYHQKLLQLMVDEQPYLDQDLNLKALADKIQLSSGYLSQIINEYEGKNFFEFVNAYRVASVKEKIIDPKYDHLNLLGIAFESGFKSKSTFNLVFKKMTGQTPTGYKKAVS